MISSSWHDRSDTVEGAPGTLLPCLNLLGVP